MSRPHSARPWTRSGLAAAFALSAARTDLGDIAEALGRSRADVDRALWILIGRTPDQALQILTAPARPFEAFAAEMFG